MLLTHFIKLEVIKCKLMTWKLMTCLYLQYFLFTSRKNAVIENYAGALKQSNAAACTVCAITSRTPKKMTSQQCKFMQKEFQGKVSFCQAGLFIRLRHTNILPSLPVFKAAIWTAQRRTDRATKCITEFNEELSSTGWVDYVNTHGNVQKYYHSKQCCVCALTDPFKAHTLIPNIPATSFHLPYFHMIHCWVAVCDIMTHAVRILRASHTWPVMKSNMCNVSCVTSDVFIMFILVVWWPTSVMLWKL